MIPWLQMLPPDILFSILVVARPTLGFLILPLTAMPIKCAALLTTGFENLFQADCVPLKLLVVYS